MESILPKATRDMRTWRLAKEDADFLSENLSRLPGDDPNFSVTLDLNGHVALRAKGEGQPRSTEIVLSRSNFTGAPIRVSSNREYVGRAVAMGFSEFQIGGAEIPVVCRDSNRTYIWMPLPKASILEPSDEAIRITSSEQSISPQEETTPKPHEERKKRPMSHTQENGNGNTLAPIAVSIRQKKTSNGSPASIVALISEAQALKEVMRDVFKRSSRLVASLKRHRKQNKIVASTLANLRQLQQIEA